jgi:hypothetical protein
MSKQVTKKSVTKLDESIKAEPHASITFLEKSDKQLDQEFLKSVVKDDSQNDHVENFLQSMLTMQQNLTVFTASDARYYSAFASIESQECDKLFKIWIDIQIKNKRVTAIHGCYDHPVYSLISVPTRRLVS